MKLARSLRGLLSRGLRHRIRHVITAIGRRLVNLRSRSLAFTLVLIACAMPSLAHADRVMLYPVAGRADPERLEQVHGVLSDILREQGHTIAPPASAERPTTSSAMQAAAGQASYVVVANIHPMPAQYRLHVFVYYVPNGRLEDLVVTVLEAEERARLSDVLSSMVRREGLGEDALRLTGSEPAPAPEGETEAERLAREERERQALEEAERVRREAEEAARLEEEERARREAEEAARRNEEAQRAWNQRQQYGADGHWMLQLRVGGGYAMRLSPLANAVRDDGGLFDVGLSVGRTFDGLDGFEVRGGIDLIAGEFAGFVVDAEGNAPGVGLTALAVHVGAAWLGSFFVEAIYIGVGGEVGAVFPFTGAREVGFSGRLSPLVAWRPSAPIMLEASILEVGVLSSGSGVVSIGGSIRAGYRFD